MFKKLKSMFLSGLFAFLPIAVTVYIVVAGVQIADNFFGQYLQSVLPAAYFFPGLGLISTILVILIIGLLLNNFLTGTLLERLQEKLTEIPLIKVIYSPLRDLMNLFSKGQGAGLKKVVLVRFGDHVSALGLVTREDFADLKLNFEISKEKVAVFVPYSYGVGGLTLLIDKSKLEPVDIPVEKAMSLAITAWIKVDSNDSKKSQVEA